MSMITLLTEGISLRNVFFMARLKLFMINLLDFSYLSKLAFITSYFIFW